MVQCHFPLIKVKLMDKYIPLIVAVLGSSGLCEIAKHFLSRNVKYKKVMAEIKRIYETLEKTSLKIDRSQAEQARIRILRFDDEIKTKNHSKDFYRQTLADIKTYEDYCKCDSGFENGYTIAAAKHIREVYQTKLNNKEF